VFLDRELPNLPSLNCRDLLAAWHVLLDFAELLAKEAASGHTLTGKDARRLALQTSSVELRRISARHWHSRATASTQ